MKVWIKDFRIGMEIKNTGMELAIYSPDGGTQLGDLYVTKTGLTWCKGKTGRANGKSISWASFIEKMEPKPKKKEVR